MSDEQTRQDVVEDNIANVLAIYGEDNWKKLLATCLTDISVSLAMLVDSQPST